MTGAIELNVPSFVVLGMVEAMGEATPYDMKQLAAISLDHFRSVRHAQLYSEPKRLTAAGYLTVREEAGGRKRRLYAITATGREALSAWLATPAPQMPELRDEALLKIFFGADPGMVTANQIALHAARLDQLEAQLSAMGEHTSPGQRLALRMGIRIETEWLAVLRDVADGRLD